MSVDLVREAIKYTFKWNIYIFVYFQQANTSNVFEPHIIDVIYYKLQRRALMRNKNVK